MTFIHHSPISIDGFSTKTSHSIHVIRQKEIFVHQISKKMGYVELVLVALAIILSVKFLKFLEDLIWKPYVLTKYFAKQGIRGASYKVFTGSLIEMMKLKDAAGKTTMDPSDHNVIPRALPHYHKWSSTYGETFLYWYGTTPTILLSDPELAKEMLSTKFGFYSKPKPKQEVVAVLGEGLVLVNGLDWVQHRRVVNPAFNTDKIKAMTKTMASSTLSKLDSWKEQVVKSDGQCKEIEMSLEFQDLAADIIAHTAFGSSYSQGKEVFEAQRQLLQNALAYFSANFIPGTQYLPTSLNRHMWKLTKKVRSTLKAIIQSRLSFKGDDNSASIYGGDLLGVLLAAYESRMKETELNMDEIIEECKTFFFAGHETTSNLLTWTMFLLSLEQQWQESLRQEVLKECGTGIPDADQLNKLKLVNMVLMEVLRLYGPVLFLVRAPTEDTKLGSWAIPKNTNISIPLAMIHRDKKYWGEDANEFNPRRFEDGVSKASNRSNALLVFSMGPRVCIGQNFAMLEAKMVLSLILQRFSFTLSPNYKHAPREFLTLQPEFGVPILLRNLHVSDN